MPGRLAFFLVVALALPAAARAAPIIVADDDLRWQVDLPESWAPVDKEELESGKMLAAFAAGRNRLVVMRLRGNTDGALGGKPAFYAGLEDGVKKEVADYRRVSGTVIRKADPAAKDRKKKGLPGYDLWYRTGTGLRGVRFLFLKNYCLMGTIDLPDTSAIPREGRRLLESLGPAAAP